MTKEDFVKKHSIWFEAHYQKYPDLDRVYEEIQKMGLLLFVLDIVHTPFGYWVAVN